MSLLFNVLSQSCKIMSLLRNITSLLRKSMSLSWNILLSNLISHYEVICPISIIIITSWNYPDTWNYHIKQFCLFYAKAEKFKVASHFPMFFNLDWLLRIPFMYHQGKIYLEKCAAFEAIGKTNIIRCSNYRRVDKILIEHGLSPAAEFLQQDIGRKFVLLNF